MMNSENDPRFSMSCGIRQRLFWQSVLPKGQTYVYLIQGDVGGPVKIGYTNRVGARVAALQTGNPQELRLLAVLPAPPSVETAYHRQLKSERLRGEWFTGPETIRLAVRILDLADEMVSAYDGSASPPDIYALDDSIKRPVANLSPKTPEKVRPCLKVVPGRKPRVSGDFFSRGMRQRWRTKPSVDAPVTVKFVDPASLQPQKPKSRPVDPEETAIVSSLAGEYWKGRIPDWLSEAEDPRP